MITISKSSYIKGLQCTKSLYLNFFHEQFGIQRNVQDTKKFETGHEVGRYAQQLFPGGIDCGYVSTGDRIKSVELTNQAILEGKEILYEAAFEYDGLLCFADIIVKQDDIWNIYEVKSTTSVKPVHINDTAFQYYIISKSLTVNDIFVVHLNNQYVRNGNIDIQQLFTKQSVLEKVLPLQKSVKVKTEEFKKITESKSIPEIKISSHCEDPYTCDFKDYCWKDVPKHSIFDIQNMRGKQFELYDMGVLRFEDIPKDFILNENQMMEVKSYLNNTDYVNTDAIKDFLSTLSYPLYFLDFETYGWAIPEYDRSKPYQQIPFQFTLYYKESKTSEALPFSFLAEGKNDPRKEFIENLIKLTEKPAMIAAYNAMFEKCRIEELARDFPEYAKQLSEINNRIIDLMEPFRQKAYYKPAMKGSYSMKAVLPAIDASYSYDNLTVQDGTDAGSEFIKLRDLEDEIEKAKVQRNLIDYCNRDTYGMVVILEELEKII